MAYSKPTYRWRILPSPIPPFFRLAREFVGYVTAYDTGLADGDNTVLRQSASLSDPAVGLSASGGAPVYYRRVEHEELAGAANLLDTALPLLRGEPVDRGAIGAPTCTQVSTHSPVELLVTDDVGRRIGRTAEDAAVLEEVPLATYDRYLDMRSVVLNAPTRSTVSLAGTGDGDATIRVRWLDGAAVTRMAVFAHVPVTARSRGSFSIEDGARSAGDLTIDLNGDGTTVLTFAPAILDGSGAEDTTPPDLTVAHLLDVFAEDRAGNLTTRQRAFDAYAYQWLPPLVAGNGRATTLSAGRTIPVRFAVRRADGSPVRDESVTVDLTDATGRPVVAPLTMGTTPAKGVVFRDGVYQADLGTKGVAPGAYLLRVRFDSSRLVGQLALGITLQ
ncbi:MAG: hypothetical protein HYX56_03015 [Chloroflexi bacterium]|nr:hypothetical protein [Chloroflexota bacterium]